MSRNIITPGNRKISVKGNEITLLNPDSKITGPEASAGWKEFLREYGKYETNISQLRLKVQTDLDITNNDITGVMEIHPTIPNLLYWTIDIESLPVNTLNPIDAIINPHKSYPGKDLPAVVDGQRYLIFENISTCDAWGVISASSNNIIERINGKWEIVWTPGSTSGIQYILNKKTSKQLKWNLQEWVFAIDGEYLPGMWRIFL